ncbi:cytidine deaminase [Megasphaera sp. DISK 18]|uniref:cytidine deaminase n=1 Tax=Megasphaera sp. DISK 18 TaxID=1776081 RepID=UPI000807064E|nr:cytidine deaminase [Megasphaera sp. DISK 18]OBZ33972.1 cytidine deaminase [Megasphaera sp. DISK 18]
MSDADLIELARDYRRHSYSPYSHFPVGAAVLMESGRVFGGCNIENASYPLSNCAERTAIFKALSEGERAFKALAVVADTDGPCSPCGACRQVMAEFRIPRIIMANMKGDMAVVSWEELLPYAFSGDALSE